MANKDRTLSKSKGGAKPAALKLSKSLQSTSKQSKTTPKPTAIVEESGSDNEDDWEDEDDEDLEEDDSASSDSNSDSDSAFDGGVDDEGMKRLMSALGDDGLDDFAAAQLGGDSDDEDEDSLEGDDDIGNGEVGTGEGESDEDDEDEQDDEDEDTTMSDGDTSTSKKRPDPKVNAAALLRIRELIQLDPSFPWTETLVSTYPESLANVDPNDDLNRELAFYKQALHGAQESRKLAEQHSLPFTRPNDYFAEMVKDDIHMERIRTKLLDEAAGMKKSEEAKKQRQLKKFGKQVQVERTKERTQAKKEMLNKVDSLKRKRGATGMEDLRDDGFEIALDDKMDDRPSKRSATSGRGRGRGRGNLSRTARDSKYHWGSATAGGGKYAKSNTRESTNDFGGGKGRGRGRGGGAGAGGRGRGGSARGGAGGSRGGGRGQKRLGKSRRQ